MIKYNKYDKRNILFINMTVVEMDRPKIFNDSITSTEHFNA